MSEKKTPTTITLLPDSTILMQARLAAGDHRTLKIRDLANLLLHDPVLTMEFIQSANSAVYGGASILDLESALSRIGSEKLVQELRELGQEKFEIDDDVSETFEFLRYNARRISIIALILASALRPPMAGQVRISALFSEVGHMAALLYLGKIYTETLKVHGRSKLAFRLEKDHKVKLDELRVKYLRARGVPERMIIPYDLDMDLKGSSEVDLRALVNSSIELVEAYANEKLHNYHPDRPLPAKSNLRLLGVTPFHMERIYKTVGEYLKKISVEEEPEGASVFLQTVEEDSTVNLDEGGKNEMRVPTYPTVIVKPKSQERLQPLCDLCEEEKDNESLKFKSTKLLNSFFDRVAFIKVPPDGDEAEIEFSAGFSEEIPKKLSIKDSLSPFKLFRLKIKSFNSKSAKPSAPFGVSSYAVGPVALLPGGEKLVLYADKRNGMTLDSRGVFRLSMSLLASRLR